MPRIARLVVPGLPHHVTQRGNRRQTVFFSAEDYRLYKTIVASFCRDAGVSIWAYCLMPNHVHLILTPETETGLNEALGEAHRRYTRAINMRQGWTGHLWQGRFASYVMDGDHLLAAAKYIEQNPVRARLSETPEAWLWSSTRAHLTGLSDGFCDPKPLLELVPDWRSFLVDGMKADKERVRIELAERTGRPQGSDEFVEKLQDRTGRSLVLQPPGRKKCAPGT
jgi:putative transposase